MTRRAVPSRDSTDRIRTGTRSRVPAKTRPAATTQIPTVIPTVRTSPVRRAASRKLTAELMAAGALAPAIFYPGREARSDQFISRDRQIAHATPGEVEHRIGKRRSHPGDPDLADPLAPRGFTYGPTSSKTSWIEPMFAGAGTGWSRYRH